LTTFAHFFHLARQPLGEFIRRAADWIGAFARDAFPHVRRLQHTHDFAVDLGDDIFRRAARRKSGLP
jgi:hypothetical protein